MDDNNKCPQCKQTSDNPSSRLVQDACGHKKCRLCLLNDEIKCMLCQETNNTEQKRENVINHTAVITCQNKVCDETALISSAVQEETSQTKINDKYSCEICNKTFKTRSHKKYHQYCAGGKKPFQCDKCKKEFILKSHLQTHILSHENRRLFKCEKCDKTFLERSKLNRHKYVHSFNKAFTCLECGKSFKNKENLRTHMIIHKPEKPYKCKECEARFSHSSNLKKHIQKHNIEKPHMCEQCGKRFKLKWGLTMHNKTHLKLKTNKCDRCDKSFLLAKDLQRHELSHVEGKGFTCGNCGTSFKRKDNLNRHSKNAHPGLQVKVVRNVVKKKAVLKKHSLVDNPNAINVITSPPPKEIATKEEESNTSFVNVPLKLAFKTSKFKTDHNIHRDYVEEPDEKAAVSIYHKILQPCTAPQATIQNNNPPHDESYSVCQKLLQPLNTPFHYETSFENTKHAIIKNIKFKLPSKYTKLKGNEKFTYKIPAKSDDDVILDDGKKTYTELKNVPTTSVIVNSNDYNHDVHWRRRTAQNFNSK